MNVETTRPFEGEHGEHLPHLGQIPSRFALRIRLYVCLVLLDVLCILVGFWLAGLIYSTTANERWLSISSVILPLYLVSAFGARAYSVEVIHKGSRSITRALRSLVMAVGAVLFIAFYLKASAEFSRAIFVIGVASSAVLLMIGRTLLVRRARSILGGNPYTVVLITETGEGFVSGDGSIVIPASRFDPESQDPAMYDRLASILQHADRVIVGCEPARRPAWMHLLKGANVQAEILTPELSAIEPITVARYAGVPSLVVSCGPLSLPDRVLKRLFDLVVAGTALVILAPLLAIVAILIKLETPGPVFFVQRRIGRGNRMFRVFKFRSMRTDASDGHGHRSTGRQDERVTAIGRFIRKTSIDELPQLFNVLMGSMSIVGPRPHALGSRAEDQLFWEIDDRYWHRHAAKPGLTGLAQVRGYRGATNKRADLVNRLHSDLEYVNNWSLWRDLKIILVTARVLIHKNAF
jgi:exopolysaccharide biosynthesis polyprenyl glycosylphosphotransferase